METRYKEMVIDLYKDGISLVGITSILYLRGFRGMRYFELRKMIFKECQRVESKRNTNWTAELYE